MSDLLIIPRTSEAQWIAERQLRVTATDIGRLANGGPAAKAAIKTEKQGVTTFRGNRYTEWGHEREPILLDHLEFLHDMTPNSALFVRGGRAATPDGVHYVGRDLMKLAEVKTTLVDWWRGGDAGTIEALRKQKRQYLDQVYWAQLVCEVGETVFAWEPHHDFLPGEIRTIVIPRDEERIEQLLEVEAEFRAFWEGDDTGGEWADFMERYAMAEQEFKRAQEALDELKNEVRERGGSGEISEVTPFGNISFTWPKASERIDTTALKKEFPDIARKFTKATAPKQQTLRITVK